MEKTTVKDNQEKEKLDKISNVDFKMVTFTLAGRDYALDIMKVKEISKAKKFTYVPNAAPFVRGVYNLRGDIISVIDLRIFFNQFNRDLMDEGKQKLEDMIILRLEDHVIAVIVDTIEKVVGVAKEEIQPPHPLFGDINIKYISGVVEKNDVLYVILDVEKIFNSQETTETVTAVPKVKALESGPAIMKAESGGGDDINLKFIQDSLQTFKFFYPSVINQDWVKKRYKEWKQLRTNEGKEIQFTGEPDAQAFLMSFKSLHNENLWPSQYRSILSSFIEKGKSGNFTIWNPGCGKGVETYSIAVMIKENFPQLNLKILANDNDLINISTAPGLVVRNEELEDPYKKFVVESSTGYQFNKEIKSAIIFEYHDITHDNNLPPLDMVVIRDVLSILPVDIQKKVLLDLKENIKPGGILIIGSNEKLPEDNSWELLDKEGVLAYRKR